MGDQTGIEWTGATWNPWMGCERVSPGCAHCYMFREQRQYGQDPTVVRRSKTKFREPLKWTEPRLVFTCSWSDFFIAQADPWRAEAWQIIRDTPHLTYQVLTKRPERIPGCLPSDWGAGYPNVWLGTSVENQRWAVRLFDLLSVPAAKHFVSCEPLLGPINLVVVPPFGGDPLQEYFPVSWVIAGGESGPRCRPTKAEWVRALRDQCRAAGVPFFFKQRGGWPDKRGGALATLDGVLHQELPQ